MQNAIQKTAHYLLLGTTWSFMSVAVLTVGLVVRSTDA